jgi:hypothetical protein
MVPHSFSEMNFGLTGARLVVAQARRERYFTNRRQCIWGCIIVPELDNLTRMMASVT